ncbi:proline and serine-rich protein 3 isoform X1 [Paramormyrops kingsleyae]|uniref:proline and serine-rich protein 3 isoform X1 n=1 Tax=Paramormyrops kingsleyae TaxID=1676925 RepID=UPI000CD663A3|nr:proline and serine-rich protein 3 isoform X3 [Paramormyrops kingsleyae]
MKSSGAIFNKRNPFPTNPALPKTHYNPSLIQKLSKQQKKTSLSPVRLPQAPSPPLPCSDSISEEDQQSLAASSCFHHSLPPSKGLHSSFSESWPSTDRQSFPETEAPAGAVPSGAPQVFAAAKTEEDSVLAKYIERFQHGRPQSREERKHSLTMDGRQSFWWLTSSPSQPTSSQSQSVQQDEETVLGPAEPCQLSPPCPHLLDHEHTIMCLSDSNCDAGEPEILHLQERTSRLLQKSEQSLSSGSLPISSEGLGSDISSAVSVDEPVRKPAPATTIDLTSEDDILFQWRLRRKMEQASQWPLQKPRGQASQQPSTTPYLTPQESTHGGFQMPTATPSLPISSPIVTMLPSDLTILPRMHLLCNMQPCLLQHPQLTVQRGSFGKPVCNPSQTQAESTECSPETVPSKNFSSLPPVSSDTAEDEQAHPGANTRRLRKVSQEVQTEQNLESTVPSCNKRNIPRHTIKPSSRHHARGEGGPQADHKMEAQLGCGATSDSKRQEVVTSWPQKSTRRGSKSEGNEVSRCRDRKGDQTPPPSPIHSTLGQVVSEVLFSAPDSPIEVKTLGFSSSPRSTPPAPPQSPAADTNRLQPPEAIVQLLREAEDSDGLEFEDDPLLQVLRQQREWVKEQISEIDAVLNDLQETGDAEE